MATRAADSAGANRSRAHGDGASERTAAVVQALQYIERRLSERVCLDDVAAAAGLPRFRLARTFAAITGVPVMEYVRNRRLTEAARSLAAGAGDILSVALHWGYASHEAFTRAFSRRFGTTPEALRARGSLGSLPLTQSLVTADIHLVELAPPHIRCGDALTIAGLRERYTGRTNAAIPVLWHRFVRRMAEIRHRAGPYAYGVCSNGDRRGGFDHLAGIAVSNTAGLPPDFEHVRLPRREYAVFLHRGRISGIRATMYSIRTEHLSRANLRLLDAPNFLRYTEAFDPRTGDGDVEIWMPVR